MVDETTEPNEVGLPPGNDEKVNAQGNVRPTTDEVGRLHASGIVHEGAANRNGLLVDRLHAARSWHGSGALRNSCNAIVGERGTVRMVNAKA